MVASRKASQNHSNKDDHINDLNVWNGAALLVADCMGTGLLALPHDVKVLGTRTGLFFLIANLPINYGAGLILSLAADRVEEGDADDNHKEYMGAQPTATNATITTRLTSESNSKFYDALEGASYVGDGQLEKDYEIDQDHQNKDSDTATFDFVGMASEIFNNPKTTRLVMILYYVNIFLVLGNYIVVMSHAVIAMLDNGGSDNGIFSCTPIAGLLASTLMFSISQLRTMARLGRTASVVSLLSLSVVVAQCLYFSRSNVEPYNGVDKFEDNISGIRLLLRQLSALGSIGFAVGSQKLFLNIRHEFADRKDAPKSLAVSLTTFGSFYVFIVTMAGDNPPGFLFDTIPHGSVHRQAAGFFLWVHVAVSYAINSQAICSSMDRNFFGRWGPVQRLSDERRWTVLTAIMASTAFFIANAIPFFKDLVAFCGALTSVPLTLLLPAIFYRRACENVPVWYPQITWKSLYTSKGWASYLLLVFSSIFMVAATLGSVYSILSDWKHHSGGFFSCQ